MEKFKDLSKTHLAFCVNYESFYVQLTFLYCFRLYWRFALYAICINSLVEAISFTSLILILIVKYSQKIFNFDDWWYCEGIIGSSQKLGLNHHQPVLKCHLIHFWSVKVVKLRRLKVASQRICGFWHWFNLRFKSLPFEKIKFYFQLSAEFW